MTLPHGLAKLVLIEQLYRISTLKTGKTYHY
ncbi:23S rRNA (pseudouridine(1915)-N(3))-methyltransferase RlmH [bacterium]|nr:23S rRNA (pseudouridine(1915)-N(3))-methyltransferase RlmH [bacterium]